MPDDLVDDEPHANGCNETEGGERRHLRRDGEEAEQQDRRDRSTPSQITLDPQTKRDVREQVQGDPSEEAENGTVGSEPLTSASEQVSAPLGRDRCRLGLAGAAEGGTVLRGARQIFARLQAAPALAEVDGLPNRAIAVSS